MRYTDKQKTTIFNKVIKKIEGGDSLLNILKMKGLPSRSVFYEWLKDADKQDTYARACEERAELLFNKILEIAETQEIGETVTTYTSGKTETVKGDMIQHRKLKIDTLKWYLGKLLPNKYGDKVIQEHKNHEGQPLVILNLGQGEKPEED